MTTNTRRLSLLLILLLLVAAAPAASHGGHEGFQQTKVVGDQYLTLEIPNVPFPTAMTRHDLNAVVGAYDPTAAENVTAIDLTLTSPANETRNIRLENPTYGIFNKPIIFETQGTWRANATLEPGNTSAEFTFEVYGPSPYVVTSPTADGPDGDIFVIGKPARLQLDATSMATGLPAPEATDATARVERWTDDHKTKLGETIVPLQSGGEGVLVLEHTFDEANMYHVFVASPTLELDYDDRPYIHVYVVTPERARELGIETAEVPAPALGLVLALAATAAVLIRRRNA